MGDEGLYACPTMIRLVRRVGARTGGSTYVSRETKRSYGMNASLSNAKMTDVEGASRRMLFAEQGFVQQSGYNYGLQDIRTSTRWHDPDDEAGGRRSFRNIDGCIDHTRGTDETFEHIGEYHNGRGHCVFLDGHTELVRYGRTRDVALGDWGD
jgi:prepilin-type processing-associated H-X9-DG protein